RSPFQRTGKSFRRATCTRLKTPVRSRFREGANVSSANPDTRHRRILHYRALGHALEGHNRPVLPPAGQFHAADRHDFSREITERQEAKKRADAVLAEYRLRVRSCR